MDKKQLIMRALKHLDLEPQVDEEGNIFIRHHFKLILFLFDNEDDNFLTVAYPGFEEVKKGDAYKMLIVCNKINRDFKLVKTYIEPTMDSVSATFEFNYTESNLKDNLERAISVFEIFRTIFTEIIRKLEHPSRENDIINEMHRVLIPLRMGTLDRICDLCNETNDSIYKKKNK